MFDSWELRQLRDIPAQTVAILTTLRDRIAAAKANTFVRYDATVDQRLAAEAVVETKRQAANATATADLNTLAERARVLQSNVIQQTGKALGRPRPTDPSADLAQVTRETRSWDRAKQILDASTSPETEAKNLVAEAAGAGDDDMVWALLAEVPSYLRGRGVDTETAKATGGMIERMLSKSNQTMAGAFASRQELDKGYPRIGVGVNQALYAIQQGSAYTTVVIPNWSDGVTDVALG